MRRALCVLLLAGCTNPDEILPVRGVVLDSAEGQVVRLLRRYQEFGTVQCSSDEAIPFKETQTDSEGKFGFDLYRIEAESFGGAGSYCFRVDATFPSGSVAWTDFNRVTIGAAVSPLRDWRPSQRIEDGVLQFEPPIPWPDETPWAPGELRVQLSHQAQVMISDGGIIWRAGDRRYSREGPLPHAPLVLDAARLEDFAGAVSLEASVFDPTEMRYGFGLGYAGPVRLRAGERLPVNGTRVPLSRGLACPELASPCPLTDGDLATVDAGRIDDFVLELPTVAAISTVVLRGVETAFPVVEVSLLQEDGGIAAATSEPMPAPDYEFGAYERSSVYLRDGGYGFLQRSYVVISLDAGVPVRKVKLHFPDGLWSAQEISLFE